MSEYPTSITRSGNRISLWTTIILVLIIISCRSVFPGWGINIPVYIALSNVVCVILGIWIIRKILLIYFTDKVSSIILILIVAGTNLWCVITYESDLIHPFLFLCYALILWFTIRWQNTFKWKYAIFLGLITSITISI